VTVDFTGDFYYIPNTFTPNNDGKNDIFILAGNECLENAKFEIFNRWGQRIFYTEKPFEEFWDGKYNGKDAAQGVYVYVFSHYRGKKNGIIHLFR
jgi:gliding motility-associated-like protein